MKYFTITTLGCKVNQFESEAIAEALKKSGWACEPRADGPEVCIINTCAVTQKAAMQSRQAVRQAVKAHPGARILVTGCYAQTDPDALKKIPGISSVLGNAAKHAIPDLLRTAPEIPEALAAPEGFNLNQVSPFGEPAPTAGGNRTRPFLKIQDGCDAFCSYCIVPYARGRSRSMPFKNIVENIRNLARAGFHEVVLCGVHLGLYGQDLTPPSTLVGVLKRSETDALIDRIRLSSIEPREISDEIINLTAVSKRLCHHFHIPLQSGDDDILKRMRRPYSRDFFRELVLKIRAAMPDAAIGADVLIGFPGETEAAFQNTYELIAELPLTYLHVFPFSARRGTPADRFPDKVPAPLIKSRCSSVRRLAILKKREFYGRFIGRTLPVLIEGRRDGSGRPRGFSANYLPVCLTGDDSLKTAIVPVRIETIGADLTLHGTLSR